MSKKGNPISRIVNQLCARFTNFPTKENFHKLVTELSAVNYDAVALTVIAPILPPSKFKSKPAKAKKGKSKPVKFPPGTPSQIIANKLHREETDEFWEQCGGYAKQHEWTIPKDRKLKLLKQMSFVVIPQQTGFSLDDRRRDFETRKHDLAPIDKYSVCFACGEKASDRHHIIQLKNGGVNSRRNLVLLCRSCHENVHPWMKDQRFMSVTVNHGTSSN